MACFNRNRFVVAVENYFKMICYTYAISILFFFSSFLRSTFSAAHGLSRVAPNLMCHQISQHTTHNQNEISTYGFETPRKSACRHLWRCCVEHHAFFRLVRVSPIQSQDTELFSLGSRFRYRWYRFCNQFLNAIFIFANAHTFSFSLFDNQITNTKISLWQKKYATK